MQIRITAAAELELDEAVAWYGQQQAGLEAAFLREFQATIRRIRIRPEIYNEIRPGIRRGLMRRFPYSIIYENGADLLLILAVAHQHRRPGYWREKP